MAASAIVGDGRWLGRLQDELRELLAPVFAEARSRLTAFAYLGALLTEPGERRSCWQLAEQAGDGSPRRMQALLAGHAWTGRRRWAGQRAARAGQGARRGGVQDQDRAGQRDDHKRGGGTAFGWVAGDEVYGRSRKLREACEDAGKGYMFAVPVNFTVRLPSGRKIPIGMLAGLVQARCWETRSCGPGCKGHRDYQWAWAAAPRTRPCPSSACSPRSANSATPAA